MKAGEIYDTLGELFTIAREQNIPTYEAADQFAEKRIEAIAELKRSYV
jgi:leucine dehydrogenase